MVLMFGKPEKGRPLGLSTCPINRCRCSRDTINLPIIEACGCEQHVNWSEFNMLGWAAEVNVFTKVVDPLAQ